MEQPKFTNWRRGQRALWKHKTGKLVFVGYFVAHFMSDMGDVYRLEDPSELQAIKS